MEKGNDDGLYISSVACCQELWALIMDAGTGFSAQVLASVQIKGPGPDPVTDPTSALTCVCQWCDVQQTGGSKPCFGINERQ